MSRKPRAGPEQQGDRFGVALLAGAVCGGLWVLLVGIVLDAMGPGRISRPLLGGVWGATGLAVALALSRPGSPRALWGRAAVAIGLHGLALPFAAAISFVVAGAQWSPSDPGRLELSATILGVRVAASPLAIRMAVGGFVGGLILLSVGDRALRGLRRPRGLGRPPG
jgi:hypothetical protein